MSFELIHTSVQKGLRGDSGFATAIATRGIPTAIEPVLAELSAYDVDSGRSVGADRIDWAHRIVNVGGKSFTVLSRTGPCGPDWSGRPNRVAHHILLSPEERAAAGPAWSLEAFSSFAESVPAVEERASGPSAPSGSLGPRRATAWERLGFDPGWAGIVARTLLDAPTSTCYVVLPAETSALPLVCDVFALLPEDRRWHVTFSTRCQRVPANTKCQLRFVRAGANGLQKLLNEPGVKQITVTAGIAADASPAAEAARAGRVVEPSPRAIPNTRVQPVLNKKPQLSEAGTEPAPRNPEPAWPAAEEPQSYDLDGDPTPAPRFGARALTATPPARQRVAPTHPASPSPASRLLKHLWTDPVSLALFAYAAIAFGAGLACIIARLAR